MNNDENLICSNCGYIFTNISLNNFALAQYVYPGNLKAIKYLIGNDINVIKCPACDILNEHDKYIHTVFINALKQFYIYVPREAEKSWLDVIESSMPEGSNYEILDEGEIFKHRIISSLFKLVNPYLSELMNILNKPEVAGNRIASWFEKYRSDLNKEFFSLLYFIYLNLIPYLVLYVDSEDSIDQDDLLDMARLHHMVLVSVLDDPEFQPKKALAEEHSRRKIISNIDIFMSMFFSRFFLEIYQDNKIREFPELVSQLVPSEIVSEILIENFSEFIKNHLDEDDHNILYCAHFALATLCKYADLDNPSEQEWLNYFVSLEMVLRAEKDNSSLEIYRPNTDDIIDTIKPELLLEFYAVRYNEINKDERIDKEDNQEIQIWLEIFKELSLSWLVGKFHTENLIIADDMLTNILDDIDVWVEQIGKHDELAKPTLLNFLINIGDKDEQELVMFSIELSKKLVDQNMDPMAIWIVCRASEILNSKHRYDFAEKVLNNCKIYLVERNRWPYLDDEYVTHIDYLTEYGNNLRNQRKPGEALKIYAQVRKYFGNDNVSRDYQVNERNISIVYRELGEFQKSYEILEGLVTLESDNFQKAGILNSMAVTQSEIGNYILAKQHLHDALISLPTGGGFEKYRLQPLFNLAQHFFYDDPEKCYELANECLEIARKKNADLYEANALGIIIALLKDSDMPKEDFYQLNVYLIQLVNEILGSNVVQSPNGLGIELQNILANSYENIGEIKIAKSLILELLDNLNPSTFIGKWKLFLKLALYETFEKNNIKAKSYLMQAQNAAIEYVGSVNLDIDPVNMMLDISSLQRYLAKNYIDNLPDTWARDDDQKSGLRMIADFQASIIQTAVLRKSSDSLLMPVNEYSNVYSDDSLKMLLTENQEEYSIMQVLNSLDGVFLIISNTNKNDASCEIIRIFEYGFDFYKLIKDVAFKLEMTPANYQGDPMLAIKEWHEFSNKFMEIINEFVPEGVHVCIVPGVLAGLPFHYLLYGRNSINYVPSVVILRILRDKKLSLSNGAYWRPKNICDFMTWKSGESENVIKAFNESEKSLKTFAESNDIERVLVKGVDATADALMFALQNNESVRISCHGRADASNNRFEFVVSANGQLPPKDVRALTSDTGKDFLLNWDEIDMINQSSPIIFSTACSSGFSVSNLGGERIGLERKFINAGTITYIAPMWSVPVKQVQSLINDIIQEYFKSNLTIADIVYNQIDAAMQIGVPNWIVKSIAIYGDWI